MNALSPLHSKAISGNKSLLSRLFSTGYRFKKGGFSDLASFAKRVVSDAARVASGIADDYVVEQLDFHDRAGLAQQLGDPVVLWTGKRIATGMLC